MSYRTIHTRKKICSAYMNSCYFQWIFFLKIFNRKIPLSFQEYLLIQHHVLLILHFILLERVKYRWNHGKCTRNLPVNSKRRSCWRLKDLFLCPQVAEWTFFILSNIIHWLFVTKSMSYVDYFTYFIIEIKCLM